MNEPTMYPTTTRPNFFSYDHFTIFISSENDLWVYGARIISVSKHTPRVKIATMTPIQNAPKGYQKARFPVNGIGNEKGNFSRYLGGYATEVPVDQPNSIITDPYVKQKIKEHYTYNHLPTTTQTP